jgi:hypothetical protein
MSDIVDRLRTYSTKWHPEDAVDLAAEAADEIERLRSLVDQCDHHEHSLQEAHAEIERLRAQPLFHLTPQEVFDLFEAGVGHGIDHSNCAWDSHRTHLLDVLFVHVMHIRHQAGSPVYDRDELRRAIEAMFEGVE